MTHPAYENPPLLEAVCEMKFVDGEEWDSTVPGLFYEKLSDQFPEKQTRRNVDVSPVQDGNSTGVQHQVQERTIFHNEEKTTFIQLAPQMLVVN